MKTADGKKNSKKLSQAIFALAAVLLFALLTVFAGDIADAAREGLELSLFTAIPALFPFFAAGALLTGSGLVHHLGRLLAKPMQALYGLSGSGAVALVLGLSGGYPVGAQTVCDLYRSHAISREEAERLIGFCNNTGPAFAVGFAGVVICGSARTGIYLYLIHVLGALITGFAMTASITKPPRTALAVSSSSTIRNPISVFLDAVRQSFATCLTITAFITFFSVLLALLRHTRLLSLIGAAASPLLSLLGFPCGTAEAAVAGILELTNGLSLLPSLHLNIHLLLPLCAFMLGFGGLSVHCQTLSILQQANLSSRRHFAGKLLHGAVSAALAVIWCHISPPALAVFSYSTYSPIGSPAASLAGYILLAIIVFALIPYPRIRKRISRTHRHPVKKRKQSLRSGRSFKTNK